VVSSSNMEYGYEGLENEGCGDDVIGVHGCDEKR